MASFGNGTNQGQNAGGFYQPANKPKVFLENYQEAINRTDGVLSIQILDGIQNLINMMPNYYGIQTQIAAEPVMWLRRKTYGTVCPNIIEFGLEETSEGQCAVSKCQLCY